VVKVTGRSLTLEEVVRVARQGQEVSIDGGALEAVAASRSVVERVTESGIPAYGVNTGFGALCDTAISRGELGLLQQNLVRSHAVGVGSVLGEAGVRAGMLLRLNSLCIGHSGVRPEVPQLLASMLNRRVHPRVYAQGSLGASGDLAPLAHLTLVMLGEGEAVYQGELLPGAEALHRAGLSPLVLEAKEGLALLNGTSFLAGLGALSCWDALRLVEVAGAAAALSLEAMGGGVAAYGPELMATRPHPGSVLVAGHLRSLLAGRRMEGRPGKLQDPYSFRCVPQVHGAVLDAALQAERVLAVELNSATDNPLVLDGRIVSGGNFHGQPVGLVMDYLGLGLAALAGIAERRTDQLLNPALSGLPAFLVANPGLNSGWMIAQYTAAALVNENRMLAAPASVHSIPVSANQEDYVSMATLAARKAGELVANTQVVLAIELLVAAQALDIRFARGARALDELGRGTRVVYSLVRERVPYLEQDRYLQPDVAAVTKLVRDGTLLDTLEREIAVFPRLTE
jgi:histidine ammonia-lyase